MRALVRVSLATAAALGSCARDAELHRPPPEGREIGPALWRYFEPLAAGAPRDPLLERVKELAAREKGKAAKMPASGPPEARVEEVPAGRPEAEDEKVEDEGSGPVGASLPPPAAPALLRLAASDEVDIVVGGRPEFSGVVHVRQDGKVALPTMGDLVGAAGLTPGGLARAVAKALHPRYLKAEPEVSVSLRSSPRLVYYVTGAVRQPGMYRMPPGGVTVLDAVLRASRPPGVSEPGVSLAAFEPVPGALYERVHVVISARGTGGGVKGKIVDLSSAMHGGPGSRELVPPGSHVIVPERRGRFSEAELRRRLSTEGVAPFEADVSQLGGAR